MRFLNYINEGRTKAIDIDKVAEYIKKYCSKNEKIVRWKVMDTSRHPIYRGVSFAGDYGFIDTNKGDLRKSANTENYMTLLIDNLPSWKGWPKRSKGLVCSTSSEKADGYGKTFHVIPFDNSQIGICPKSDIFLSFNLKFAMDNFLLPNVGFFNDELLYLFQEHNLKTETYNDLKKSLIYLNEKESGSMFFNKNIDVMKLLNDKLSPQKNGFKQGINHLKQGLNDKEIWIQGKCVLLSDKGLRKINEIL